jgi:hypothetical protein
MTGRPISLDCDGVLHPASHREGPPLQFLPILVELLRDWPDVCVVVHPSWDEPRPREELAEFTSELGANFLGTVGTGARADAIQKFVAEHPDYQDVLVVDDDHSEFPLSFPLELVLCNPPSGLADEAIQERLKDWLWREPATLAELDAGNDTIRPLLEVLEPYLPAAELADASARIEEWRSHAASADVGGYRGTGQTKAAARAAVVKAVVSVVIPEFETVHLEVRDGRTFCVGARTPGVSLHELVLGDQLICVVAGTTATRVLFAKRIAGLDLAQDRGQQLARTWTRNGELLSADEFAAKLGLTKTELTESEARGEVFSLEVDSGRWYPSELLKIPLENMLVICRVISPLTVGERFTFCVRKHGAVGGKTVAEAIPASGIDRVLWLANLWVRDRAGT